MPGLKVDLKELQSAGILTEEISQQIENFYKHRKKESGFGFFHIFGIFGALLTGLGIILILAHNWDQFSRASKSVIAFLPLLIGQFVVYYSTEKKSHSLSWSEGASVFLFLAVGITNFMVAQIYNLTGEASSFILSWVLLGLPIVYLMRSKASSFLYLIGITLYVINKGYTDNAASEPWLYLVLLLLFIPFYRLLKSDTKSLNAHIVQNWMLIVSFVIALGAFIEIGNGLGIYVYTAFLSLMYIIGHTGRFESYKISNNPFRVVGVLGSFGLMMSFTFEWFWNDISSLTHFEDYDKITLLFSIVLTVLYLFVFARFHVKNFKSQTLAYVLFPLFLVSFLLEKSGIKAGIIIMNISMLFISILKIRQGAMDFDILQFNFGTLLLSILIFARFFDFDVDFLTKGIVFILFGIAFFYTNYRLFKVKSKKNENTI